jgi:hypothetical protein
MASKSDDRLDHDAIKRHTVALREHTRELKRHSKALTKASKSHANLAVALENSTAAFNYLPAAAPLTRQQVRKVLASALSRQASDLKDGIKVADILAGDGGVSDILMSKINQAFWPGVMVPHLTYAKIKNLTIKDLISLIQKSL